MTLGDHGSDSNQESVDARSALVGLTVFSLSACDEKDEEKASQNRPAIPGC
jgi:hypothetical protein